MNIGFSDIGLSPAIANDIIIPCQNDGKTADISVIINGVTIYSTTLYVVDDNVRLYALGTLVNDYMRSHGIIMAKLKVNAYFETHLDNAEVVVIYSAIRTSYESDIEFLLKHYLTTRSSYTIPRGKYLQVAFFNPAQDQSTSGSFEVSFRLNDGSVHSARVPHELNDMQDDYVYYFSISAPSLENDLRRLYPNDNPIVLGGSVIHGNRSLDFYFVDEQPVEEFIFQNAFNVWEHYYAYGTTKKKTEVNHKEGVVHGVSTYYDQSHESKVQVETFPLTLEEADWLNQFLYSPCICKIIPPDDDRTILLSDISSEISDSPKDKNIIKFSWKYAEPYHWKIFGEIPQVFRHEYSEPFA